MSSKCQFFPKNVQSTEILVQIAVDLDFLQTFCFLRRHRFFTFSYVMLCHVMSCYVCTYPGCYTIIFQQTLIMYSILNCTLQQLRPRTWLCSVFCVILLCIATQPNVLLSSTAVLQYCEGTIMYYYTKYNTVGNGRGLYMCCLLYTSPSPRDRG